MRIFLIRLALEILLEASSIDTPLELEVIVSVVSLNLIEELM